MSRLRWLFGEERVDSAFQSLQLPSHRLQRRRLLIVLRRQLRLEVLDLLLQAAIVSLLKLAF